MGIQKGQSASTSQGTSQSYVDPRQVPFLDTLRREGQNIAIGQLPVIGDVASQITGQVGGMADRVLGSLEPRVSGVPTAGTAVSELLGIASSPDAQAVRGLAMPGEIPGAGIMQMIAEGGTEGADLLAMLDGGEALQGSLGTLDEAIQRNLSRNLETLGSEAALAGGSGGDREAYFASRGAGDAGRAFASGASQLISSDLSARRGLAATIEQLRQADTGMRLDAATSAATTDLKSRQQGGGLLMGLIQAATQGAGAAGEIGLGEATAGTTAAATALQGGQQRLNLGLAPFAAQLSPLLALADIIGPATVLSESQQRSRGGSSSYGFQI